MSFVSFQELLKKLAQNYPGFKKKLQERTLFRAWEHIAGPIIVRHAKPVRVFKKKLMIAVDHATWKMELFYRKQFFLDQLAQKGFVLKDLIFVEKNLNRGRKKSQKFPRYKKKQQNSSYKKDEKKKLF